MSGTLPTPAEVAKLRNVSRSVAELLDFFGVRVRNAAELGRIDTLLAQSGLVTVPYYGTAGQDERIRVVVAGSPAGDAVEADREELIEDEMPIGALPADPLRLRSLPSAKGGLTSVRPDNSLQQAVMLMMEKGFSQLPVIDGLYALRGVVTWASIARMYAASPMQDLAHATDSECPVAEINSTLQSVLPRIDQYGYCLVRDDFGQLGGIVTASDVAVQFEELSRPFFTIGAIERCLRERLGPVFTPAEFRAAGAMHQGKPSDSVEHLMFSGYAKLLKQDEGWKRMNWHGIDKDEFLHHLTQVNYVRNEVMHFDRRLNPAKHEALIRFAELVRGIPVQRTG
jgi:CBS domain-containing protein